MWFICGIFQRQIDFYHIRQKTIWYTLQGITCFFLFVCLFFVATDLLDLLSLKSQDLKEKSRFERKCKNTSKSFDLVFIPTENKFVRE